MSVERAHTFQTALLVRVSIERSSSIQLNKYLLDFKYHNLAENRVRIPTCKSQIITQMKIVNKRKSDYY